MILECPLELSDCRRVGLTTNPNYDFGPRSSQKAAYFALAVLWCRASDSKRNLLVISRTVLAEAIALKFVEPVCSDTLWRLIKVRRRGTRGFQQSVDKLQRD